MLDDVFKIEISASAVAWYGAIVATIGGLVGLLNYLRDRARVKVKVSQGMFVYKQGLGNELQVIIQAINFGRRPITMTSVGFALDNKHKLVITSHTNITFPVEVHEGKSIEAFISNEDVKMATNEVNAKIKNAWFQDATGKVYRKKWKLDKKL
jgi:hypothetical protein